LKGYAAIYESGCGGKIKLSLLITSRRLHLLGRALVGRVVVMRRGRIREHPKPMCRVFHGVIFDMNIPECRNRPSEQIARVTQGNDPGMLTFLRGTCSPLDKCKDSFSSPKGHDRLDRKTRFREHRRYESLCLQSFAGSPPMNWGLATPHSRTSTARQMRPPHRSKESQSTTMECGDSWHGSRISTRLNNVKTRLP